MGDRFLTPLMAFLTARLMNIVGNASSLTSDHSLINYYLILSSFFLHAHVSFIRINLIIVCVNIYIYIKKNDISPPTKYYHDRNDTL